MATQRYMPVIIGVGDVKNESVRLEDAIEPAQLMFQAIMLAIRDSNLPPSVAGELQSEIDSLDIVASWTWPYRDLPGLLSERLGVQPRRQFYSTLGGHQPVRLLDETARRISFGESTVAVLTGGEALASLSAFAKAKKLPPPRWTRPETSVDAVFSPTTRDLGKNLGAIHSVGAPIHVYPLYENGFRAFRGQSGQDNHQESARLYAQFSEVAEHNPLAWNYGKPAETEEFVGTVSPTNRMICFPYLRSMNAFNNVNLAAAILLTSKEHAIELGVPESRWIYPLGGAGTQDRQHCAEFVWERLNFYTSPAMSKSLDEGLRSSDLRNDDIDIFDFYSCFPIVPKLACEHLGLPINKSTRPTTLLGGLTSFGGPGNNYSMHVSSEDVFKRILVNAVEAVTEMVRQLRKGKGRNGLILANGGALTYQHVICLSRQPRRAGSPYPNRNPLPELLYHTPAVPVDDHAEGEAIIETYTVEFNRDGSPRRGHVVGRLKSNGHRFLANHGNTTTLLQLSSITHEQIGQAGTVQRDPEKAGRMLFFLDTGLKL